MTEPVVLYFGLLRPYKGVDVLLEAWRALRADAELWMVGMPRMDIGALRAGRAPVRALGAALRSEEEIIAYVERADLVVLPIARWTSRACCSRRSRSVRRCC